MVKMTVVLGFLVAAAGCQTPSTSVFLESGDPALTAGSVVFGGMDGNLYATRGDNDIVQLTRNGGGGSEGPVYGAYGWSGDRVVFGAQELSGDREITGFIYSVVPGESPRRLVRRRGFAPFFIYPSPDNNRVGYLGSVIGEQGFLMGSVAANGRQDVVHGVGQPFYSAWSPDGLRLLTHIGLPFGPSGSRMQFQSVDVMIGGGSPEPVLDLRTGSFQAPAFSPDGESIAVSLRRAGTNVLALISPDGAVIRDIAPLNGTAAMEWSGSGKQLAFIDGQYLQTGGITGSLWISSSTGALRQVSERVAAFFWSPDGSKLIYFEPFFAGSGSRGTLLYRLGLYRPSEDNSENIGLLRPSEAFVRQIVPFFDQYHRAYTIWSPDSQLVVLNSTRADGVPVIHLVDTERLRSSEQFSVAFTIPAQSNPEDGLITEDGVTTRVLSYGTVPFFSTEPAVFSRPEESRQGT